MGAMGDILCNDMTDLANVEHEFKQNQNHLPTKLSNPASMSL
jgi:hypothetical protein